MKEEISKKIKWLLMMDYVNSPRTCEYLGRFCEITGLWSFLSVAIDQQARVLAVLPG